MPVLRFPLLVVVALLAAGCTQRQLMPTPNLYLCTDLDPFASVPEALQTPAVDLLYATDRRIEAGKTGAELYGYERSASLAFGSCTVNLGNERMTWPELVELSRTATRRHPVVMTIGAVTELGRFAPTPLPVIRNAEGRLEVEPDAMAGALALLETFYAELDRRLALTPRKEVFIFIHGYRNTFADAAYAMAELWHFLGREGVPIVYSWPAGSPGLLRGYTHDRESGEFTILHLKNVLRVLAAHPGVEKVNVIAHSRGTDVASTAIRELVIEARRCGDPRREYKLGRVILASPDLDYDVLTQRLVAERLDANDATTIYVSKTDKAIGVADWLFNSDRRLGQLRPEDIDENLWESLEEARSLTIVDAQVQRSDEHGHSYFRSNPGCSSDVILFLRYGEPAGSPRRPLRPTAHGFWVLDDRYPCR